MRPVHYAISGEAEEEERLCDERRRRARYEVEELERIREEALAGDRQALTPFMDAGPSPRIILADSPPNIFDGQGHRKPASGICIEDMSQKEIQEEKATMKAYFPEVEFGMGHDRSGRRMLVFIGIDAKTANAATNLEVERELAATVAAIVDRNCPSKAASYTAAAGIAERLKASGLRQDGPGGSQPRAPLPVPHNGPASTRSR